MDEINARIMDDELAGDVTNGKRLRVNAYY